MISDAQNAANLGSASRLAANEMGLSLSRAAEWSYEARVDYLHKLASKILQYPTQFNPLTLQMASDIAGTAFPGLDDDSGTFAEFGENLGNNVLKAGEDLAALGNGVLAAIRGTGNALGGIGQGIQNAGNVSTWLIPLGAVLLVVMLTQSAASKVSRSRWTK